MLKNELTKYELSRFNKNCECKICNNIIMDQDQFEMIKHKNGRFVNYAFVHTICLFQPKKRFQFKEVLEKIDDDNEENSSQLERRKYGNNIFIC